jgi:hypothetical protein
MDSKNVIWITSYPKSGNTWIHSVLRNAGRDYGFPQGELDVYNIAASGKELVHCDAVAKRFANLPCVALKTHRVFKPDGALHPLAGVEPINAGYIHVYRNPLDVLLSYLNFTRIEYKSRQQDQPYRKELFRDLLGFEQDFTYQDWVGMSLDKLPQANLDHALDRFSEQGTAIASLSPMSGTWADHTRSWLNASEHMPGFSIRYEDCLKDRTEITKLSEFFLFSAEEVSVALSAIDAFTQRVATGAQTDQTIFFNKMEAYYFSQYFSKAAVDRFFTRHETLLRELGYSDMLQARI